MTALGDTNSTSTNTTTTTTTPTTTPTTTDTTTAPQFDMPMMGQEFIGGHGERGYGMNMMGGVEISSAYNATVTAILENDTDVANLISQGYNVTYIHPIVKTVVQGDGTLTSQATTAIVTMTNGTTGYARVNVDIANSKVTYISIVTRTVIDKSSS